MSWFDIGQKLGKTRQLLGRGIVSLLGGKRQLDPELLAQLERTLLMADVGVEMTQAMMDALKSAPREEHQDLLDVLKAQLIQRLTPHCQPLRLPAEEPLFVIVMVGINGAGKTTTTAKIARHFQLQGKRVMMAAGDTFRAAAVEQLKHWGARFDIPVIAQKIGADSAAVVYDACQSAIARGADVLLVDTAGRLHTQAPLMEELKKMKRVLQKCNPAWPQEVMLVLDAGTGQNALKQVKQFQEAIGVTGLALTKLDGTAKGGGVFALTQMTALPLRYIGMGEAVEDLQPLKANDFVEAIFHDYSI